MTEDRIEEIKKDYDSGLTYKEIQAKYDLCAAEVTTIVRGRRSRSDAMKLAIKKGRRILSEEGRLTLSENGKRAIKNSSKCWTKPEREFVSILRDNSIGVRFPEYMCELFNLVSDKDAKILVQYPIQRYICDFVEPGQKIIFRVQGDFWHANPLLYDENKLTKIQIFNKNRDNLAKIYFEKHGWKVIDVWESEIYWNKAIVLDKIGRIAQLVRASALQAEGSPFESGRDHQIEDWTIRLKELWFKKPRVPKPKTIFKYKCTRCGNEFETTKENRKVCRIGCGSNRPSKEELLLLLDTMTIIEVAKKYEMSDNAVRKWLRVYQITYGKKHQWSESVKKEIAEKRHAESVRLHTCKCGGYIRNLRAKMCRKCWLEQKY